MTRYVVARLILALVGVTAVTFLGTALHVHLLWMLAADALIAVAMASREDPGLRPRAPDPGADRP